MRQRNNNVSQPPAGGIKVLLTTVQAMVQPPPDLPGEKVGGGGTLAVVGGQGAEQLSAQAAGVKGELRKWGVGGGRTALKCARVGAMGSGQCSTIGILKTWISLLSSAKFFRIWSARDITPTFLGRPPSRVLGMCALPPITELPILMKMRLSFYPPLVPPSYRHVCPTLPPQYGEHHAWFSRGEARPWR